MATVHITEAEAAKDFAALLARARAGDEVFIDSQTEPVLVLHAALLRRPLSDALSPADPRSTRLLSESLRIAEQLGLNARLDGSFERQLTQAVESHPEALDLTWD